jgi:L-ascorbate metabolism protein UlaG (beta-lactamase superfamily)
MKFTYYGHSCFSVESDGKNYLFDPFISGNELAKGKVDVEKINADYIFASHGHFDHVADLVPIAQRTGAKLLAAYEIVSWAQGHGVANTHPLNFGSTQFDFGKLHFVPAAHSSSLHDGTYGGNPGGFILKLRGGSFYYSGDTSLTAEMTMIPYYGKLDFALLPIGGNFTMDVDDALVAAGIIGCNKIIGLHYDTFGYIRIDHKAAVGKFADAGKTLILPEIGETIEI